MNVRNHVVRGACLAGLLLAASLANAQEYRIQPGDVLAIAVDVGMPDYVAPPEVTVGPDGLFAYPVVGEIAAAGKTRQEIAAEIRTALEALYRKVDVTVNVGQYRARNVFVLGEVPKPGPVSVLGPSVSLEQVLAEAGGPTPRADHAMLYRAGEEPREIALSGAPTGAVSLLPGDVLDLVQRQPLTVVGEVAKPGPLDVPKDARLTDALALAGGLTPEADPQHAVLVNHQSRTTVVDLEQVLADPQGPINLPVADYHTLVVAKRQAVAVIGEVGSPGLYSGGHDMRLTQLLALAGGLTPAAGALATAVDERGQVVRLDIQAALNAAASESDPLVQGYRTIVVPTEGRQTTVLGEVRTPGSLEAGTPPLPLLALLAQVGGPTEGADLRRVMVYGGDGAQSAVDVSGLLGTAATGGAGESPLTNPTIAKGSVVVVPRRLARVMVLGAVREPGSYTFAEGDTVVDAIALAGGFGEKAVMAKVGLLRRRADAVEVIELNLRAGLGGGEDLLAGPLQDRDVVMAPTGKGTNWAQIAAMLFGLSTIYRDVTH